MFCKTGADGSKAAFWIDEQGNQRIVHLGSGSGSVLTCVLAEDPVDFLRLIAIGYGEICWNDQYAAPPNEGRGPGHLFVHPNIPFQNWVTETFHAAIPKCALEIVKHPAEMDESASEDGFFNWLQR